MKFVFLSDGLRRYNICIFIFSFLFFRFLQLKSVTTSIHKADCNVVLMHSFEIAIHFVCYFLLSLKLATDADAAFCVGVCMFFFSENHSTIRAWLRNFENFSIEFCSQNFCLLVAAGYAHSTNLLLINLNKKVFIS